MRALSSLWEESVQEMGRGEGADQVNSHLQKHIVKSLGLRLDEKHWGACVNNLKQR